VSDHDHDHDQGLRKTKYVTDVKAQSPKTSENEKTDILAIGK